MMTHMSKSRLHVERLRTRPGLPTSIPREPQRVCPCGTVLGQWNRSTLCSLCQSKQADPADHRMKLPPSSYEDICSLRAEGWTWGQISGITGLSPNYLSAVIARYKKERKETDGR